MMNSKYLILASLLAGVSSGAMADGLNIPATVNPAQSQANNHLANIDNALAYQSTSAQQVYSNLGMVTLNSAYPIGATIPASPMTINNYWGALCGLDTQNTVYLYFSGLQGSTQGASATQNLTCENTVSAANANNVIPLVMAPTTNVMLPVLPKQSNLNQTQGNLSPVAQSQQFISQLTTQDSGQNAVQSYVDALTSVNTGAGTTLNTSDMPNNVPELTLISGVLQAVANDYQGNASSNTGSNSCTDTSGANSSNGSSSSSGTNNSNGAANSNCNQPKIPAIEASVNQVFTPAYSTELASANTPQLLRMLILETAKSNQIKALQIEQQERNNVLLAAVLADLVKLNVTDTAVNSQMIKLQNVEQSNGVYLNMINNSLNRGGK